MERGVVSLEDRILAATAFTADLLGDAEGWSSRPLLPGTKFRKSWKVKNAGTTAWTNETVEGVHVRGDVLAGIAAAVPCAAPGETVLISVDMIAPQAEGSFAGTWNLQHTGTQAHAALADTGTHAAFGDTGTKAFGDTGTQAAFG